MQTRRSFLRAGLGGLAALSAGAAGAVRALAATEVVSTAGQINHVMVDDGVLYWTERNARGSAVRSMAVGGGPITNLATEGVRDPNGFFLNYVHLLKNETDIFWTRQRTGFINHWSVRSLPRGGGTVTTVFPEEASLDPLYLQGWRIIGEQVVAVTPTPLPLGVPISTQLAASDPANPGKFIPLVETSKFPKKLYILAVDDDFVYVRGLNADHLPEIGRVSPSQGATSYQTLFTGRGTESDLTEIGAVDGAALYFWSRKSSGPNTLNALPLAGGTPVRYYNTPLGKGLVTDGKNLYWSVGGTLMKAPVGGGSRPQPIATGAYAASLIAGPALADTSLYFARKNGNKFSIAEVPK